MNLNYWPWNLYRLKFPFLAWEIGGPSSGLSSVTKQLCAFRQGT